MGAGFLIIHSAIKHAAEKVREEEEKEKNMIDKGYTKRFMKINEGSSYTHVYRNLEKRQNGFYIIVISLLFLSILSNQSLFLIDKIGNWIFLPMISIIIFLIIGIYKFYNKTYFENQKKETLKLEGFVLLSSKDKPLYADKWVDTKTGKIVYE